MLRRPHFVTAFRRHLRALLAAMVLAQAGLALHALGHELAIAGGQADNGVCELCAAAQQFEHGIARAVVVVACVLPVSSVVVAAPRVLARTAPRAFAARAPPAHVHA